MAVVHKRKSIPPAFGSGGCITYGEKTKGWASQKIKVN